MAAFACAPPGYASTFVLMSEGDLAARSVAAITGWVTDIEAAAVPETGGVNTYVHIEPEEIVFGTVPDGTVVLREPGGRVRGQSEWIFGSAEYRIGEEVLVFLSQNADGTLRTTAMSMGKFTIEADERGTLTAMRRLGEGAALWDLERGQLVTEPGPETYDLQGLVDAVRAAAPVRAAARAAKLPMKIVPPELLHAAVRAPGSVHVSQHAIAMVRAGRWGSHLVPDRRYRRRRTRRHHLARRDQRRVRRLDERADRLDHVDGWRHAAGQDNVQRLRSGQPHHVQRPLQRGD